MILIIGGAYQGKRDFARKLSGLEPQEFERRAADGCGPEEETGLKAEFLCHAEFLLNYHGFVRQLLKQGTDAASFTRQVIASNPALVTLDEVGCGIVPLEKAERQYREAVGEAGQLLAAAADQVYRVLAGIPVRIK